MTLQPQETATLAGVQVAQIYDKGLAHASYAIASEGQVAVIDPARDPAPYEAFARAHNARIVAVLQTHPHADFASSHLELAQQHGAKIYHNDRMGAHYAYQTFNDGDELRLGQATLRALFTPGHSPDHNSYLLLDAESTPVAVFTGDSLFIGDVGRPDLRGSAGHLTGQKEELAAQMFDTLQTVFRPMPDAVKVYPAHGAGSACGRHMSEETVSTIGQQKAENWALQESDKVAFVKALLEDQPDVPQYFPYSVEVNRNGLPALADSLDKIPTLHSPDQLVADVLRVDARPIAAFKAGHLPGALHIPDGGQFETWLGTLLAPETPFYLLVDRPQDRDAVLHKAAKIGYEAFVKGTLALAGHALPQKGTLADPAALRQDASRFTIVDIRRAAEVAEKPVFEHSLHIPLKDLAARAHEVPTDKPVVVHCAGGYRSAVGSSILMRELVGRAEVLDLSEGIKMFI